MDLKKMQQNTVDKVNKEIDNYTFLSVRIKDLLEELISIRDGLVSFDKAKELKYEVNNKMNDMILEILITTPDMQEFKDFIKNEFSKRDGEMND
jgi:hypothetical protein